MGQSQINDSFRAQLVLPEQRHIYDYWLGIAGERAYPSRKEVNPSHIIRLLPFVSLIDIKRSPLDFRYRLSGTMLRDVFERELTGTSIKDFTDGQKRDYWFSALERLSKTGKPSQGILRGPESSRDHLVQFWLRLPLGTERDGINMVLGFDKCISVSDAKNAQAVLGRTSL